MKLYTMKDACRLLNMSPQTLRRWVKKGKIKCTITPGGHRRFPQEEIARHLDCSIEALNKIKVDVPQKGLSGLNKEEREVKSLELKIKKEKASRTLKKFRNNDVQKARDSLAIMKIEKKKEKLMAEEKRQKINKLKDEERQIWLDQCVEYAYKCLYGIPDIFKMMPNQDPIPLEIKVKTRRAVKGALADISINENVDELRLLIENVVEPIHKDYLKKYHYPQCKAMLIKSALAGLVLPMWLDTRDTKILTSEIRKYLVDNIEGWEDFEVVHEMANDLNDRLVRSVEMIRNENQRNSSEDLIHTIKETMLNLKEHLK